jgi:hypothetical protein
MFRLTIFLLLCVTVCTLWAQNSAAPGGSEIPAGSILWISLPETIRSNGVENGKVIDVPVRAELELDGKTAKLGDARAKLEVREASSYKKGEREARLCFHVSTLTWKKKVYVVNGYLFGKFQKPASQESNGRMFTALVQVPSSSPVAVAGVPQPSLSKPTPGLPDGVELKILPDIGPTLISKTGDIVLDKGTVFAVRSTPNKQ